MNQRTKNSFIPHKVINGLKIPKNANDSYFNAAMSYEPKKGDIFLVSYPKCGTTWVQHIIYLIFHKGKPAKDVSDIISSIPFPEQDGFLNTDTPIIAMKYHLPFYLMPFLDDARYIVVTRNPLDTCVSYYNFLKRLPNYDIENFRIFYEAFLLGELPYGDYFDHLLTWYENRNRSNILMLTYESIKDNHYEAVKRIIRFLNKTEILENENILKDIVFHSSLDFMKTFVEGGNFMETYLKVTSTIGIHNNLQDVSQIGSKISVTNKKPQMIRKGCVGDWKNYFSSQQEKQMKAKLSQTAAGLNLWPEIIKDM